MSAKDVDLVVVVPVTRMHGKLQNLKNWLTIDHLKKIRVVIVHDLADYETGIELRELVGGLDSNNLIFVEGCFGSPGAARNFGFKFINESKWIAFWDSDDIPNVDEFLEMLKAAEHGNFNSAIGGFEKITTKHVHGISSQSKVENLDLNNFSIQMNPGLWRWGFRISSLEKKTFENFLMAEDQIFIYENFIATLPNYFHNKIVYSYFTDTTGQLTRNLIALSDVKKSIIYLSKSPELSNVQKAELQCTLLIRLSLSGIKLANYVTKISCLFHLSWYLLSTKTLLSFNEKVKLLKIIFQNRNSLKEKPVTMFLFGGLGNQLFQLAAGIEFAKGRKLKLDSSYNPKAKPFKCQDLMEFDLEPMKLYSISDQKRNKIEIRFFNFAIRLSAREEKSYASNILGKFLRSIFRFLLTIIYKDKFFISSGVGFDPKLRNDKSRNFIGYFQTYKYASNLFKLQLKDKSIYFLKELNELRNLDSLIVHIRLGDYRNEIKFGLQSEEYFSKALIKLWATHSYKKICLFSDESNAAIEFIPEELRRHVHIPNWQVLSAAENLELMRYGSAYVLSNSTYGWWAAMLSYYNNPVVIIPKIWFKQKKEPNLLIPNNWIRFGEES